MAGICQYCGNVLRGKSIPRSAIFNKTADVKVCPTCDKIDLRPPERKALWSRG